MPRHGPSICKRRGCSTVRERWQLVCADCWREVSHPQRVRYVRARKAKLTQIAGELGREILRLLGRKHADAPAPSPGSPTPTQAYARSCALLGEHEEEHA